MNKPPDKDVVLSMGYDIQEIKCMLRCFIDNVNYHKFTTKVLTKHLINAVSLLDNYRSVMKVKLPNDVPTDHIMFDIDGLSDKEMVVRMSHDIQEVVESFLWYRTNRSYLGLSSDDAVEHLIAARKQIDIFVAKVSNSLVDKGIIEDVSMFYQTYSERVF